jgi:hypothetical protein
VFDEADTGDAPIPWELIFVAIEGESELVIWTNGAEGLFSEATLAAMAEEFVRVLDEVSRV